ncbi:hypothetical protein BN1708_017356, partial [Verticillium longisporum]
AADHETPVVELDQQSALRQDANATATANANAHLLSKLQAAAAQDTNARRLLANLLTRAQAVTSSSAAAASSSSFSSQTSFGDLRTSQFLASLEEPDLQAQLPAFVKPLPARIASEDVKYLHTKGALSLPPLPLQTALLQAYVEYVHPYMPLLDLREFLGAVNARDGLCGQVSLFLYQAIMFAATAFVDMKALKEAGYSTRKAARRSFFSKTRLLYDFDYESDRLVLVQALLLMTYWYETPDDQKDTWHWMGVAISLAHTIGLHRNPATTSMPLRKQKLWKRIWWSCFMRDRLVALGMRRPTRIKDEDYDDGIRLIGDKAILRPPVTAPKKPNGCVGLAGDGTAAGICIIGPKVKLDPFPGQEHRKVASVDKAVRDVRVEGFEVRDFQGLNIAIVGAKNTEVKHNTVVDGTAYGILTVGSVATRITGNKVSSSSLLFIGICMDDKSDVAVTKNTISDYGIGLCVQTN